jgi:hypothetical protein
MRFGVLALATFLLAALPVQAADLSPARWPQATRTDLEARERPFMPQATREVRGAVLITG